MVEQLVAHIGRLEDLIRNMAINDGSQAGAPVPAFGTHQNLTVNPNEVDEGY